MTLSIGSRVLYRLSAGDVSHIDNNRPMHRGNQVRNPVSEGQVLPATVVALFGTGSTANLKVMLDGEDDYWATSRTLGEGNGHWFWPEQG